MFAKAIIIVPPFIKYNAGPLLGPALLQSAARKRGHSCSVMDLNALWIKSWLPTASSQDRDSDRGTPGTQINSIFIGDHSKPPNGLLDKVEGMWISEMMEHLFQLRASRCLHENDSAHDLESRLHFGFFRHEEVHFGAVLLAASPFGSWVRNHLLQIVEQHRLRRRDGSPHLVGISLLHAGQIIPATTISLVAKKLWPDSLIVWGGPHITGLGEAIHEDPEVRSSIAADLFIQGHAEQTFVDVLDTVACRGTAELHHQNSGMIALSGARGSFIIQPAVPSFDNLGDYNRPLTLPAQSSVGCPYGKCTFCTYPSMEGKPMQLPLQASIGAVVDQAQRLGPDLCRGISLKDSLIPAARLHEISHLIRGRVRWSACTKLSNRLTLKDTLISLREGGLTTLEVGLESLLPETQLRVRKVQPQLLFEKFLAEVKKVEGLSLVVNYMTGFPWEDDLEAYHKMDEAKRLISMHLADRGKLEHNTFELERLSPMAQDPERYSIDSQSLRRWPWASVIEQTTAKSQ